MAYDLAPSLKQFRSEVNARWPQRDKSSDGWIGDLSHQARPSDHNPGARDLVHAFDTDEDLDGDRADSGADAWQIVQQIVSNRDPRVKYLIYEARIIAGNLGPSPWVWRPYTGVNAHRHHVHLSILSTPEAEQDTSPWLAPKQGGSIEKPLPIPPEDEMTTFAMVRAGDDRRVYFTDGRRRLLIEGVPDGMKAYREVRDTYRRLGYEVTEASPDMAHQVPAYVVANLEPWRPGVDDKYLPFPAG